MLRRDFPQHPFIFCFSKLQKSGRFPQPSNYSKFWKIKAPPWLSDVPQNIISFSKFRFIDKLRTKYRKFQFLKIIIPIYPACNISDFSKFHLFVYLLLIYPIEFYFSKLIIYGVVPQFSEVLKNYNYSATVPKIRNF